MGAVHEEPPEIEQSTYRWRPRSSHLPLLLGAVPPVIYLVWVNHFAVDALQGDDWNMIPQAAVATQGHVGLSGLWSQYYETRIPLIRAIFDVAAVTDHLNTRTLILLNALIYIAAYCVLLRILRRYVGGPLSVLTVVPLGLVWFTFAGVQTSLWAFQIGWYLVVLFMIVAFYGLLVPSEHHRVWLGISIVAAVLCTLSFSNGIVVWPLGLAAMLWSTTLPAKREHLLSAAIWSMFGILTAAMYFIGFKSNETGCERILGCVPGYAHSHPTEAVRFTLVLLGNVIPGGYFSGSPKHLGRWEAVGLLILIAAIWVLIQSWRHRKTSEQMPVPALLIAFDLLFDILIVYGRAGSGLIAAVNSNRYIMPNAIIVAGLVIYFVRDRKTNRKAAIGFAAVMMFLVAQVTVGTMFGLKNARADAAFVRDGARLLISPLHEGRSVLACESSYLFLPAGPLVDQARSARLAEFQPTVSRYFLHLGPPSTLPSCVPAAPGSGGTS